MGRVGAATAACILRGESDTRSALHLTERDFVCQQLKCPVGREHCDEAVWRDVAVDKTTGHFDQLERYPPGEDPLFQETRGAV